MGYGPENIDLIKDVPLEVTVELGRTSKSIKEILDFAPGTIIELNRIAGEPIDVLVNGKYVAKGEVVIIEAVSYTHLDVYKRQVLATYNEAEDLINIGAYKSGSNREIDYAVQKINAVNQFLCQRTDEKFLFDEEIDLLKKLFED